MYIITTLFLASMILGIQALLLQYSNIDLSDYHKSYSTYVIENIRDVFQKALESSDNCTKARENVIDLRNLVNTVIRGGYHVMVSGDVNCTGSGEWADSGSDLELYIRLSNENGETDARYELNRKVVYIYPETQSTVTGNNINVDIRISGAKNLYAFQFDLEYNDSVLSFVSINEGPFLGSDGSSTFWINDPTDDITGLVRNIADSRVGPVDGIDGDGVIATAVFSSRDSGEGTIALKNAIFTEQSGDTIIFALKEGKVNVA